MKFGVITAIVTHSIAALACATVQSSPKCKDPDRQDVDWFIIYKLPRMTPNSENSMRPQGGEFVYIDARTTQEPLRYWKLSEEDLYQTNNPVAFTLAPLYQKTPRQDLMYSVYNDQSPGKYNGTRNGHSKGVLLFDDSYGLWLLHSVPKFLQGLRSGQYSFPDTARENGQLFMCVTFPTAQVDTIAQLLRTEYANVYEMKVPQSMKDKYQQVEMLSRDSFVRGSTKLFITNLTSAGGVALRAYAKRATLAEDLYSYVLAKDLQDDLVAQTWRNGAGGPLPPYCNTSYTVTNVDSVKLSFDAQQSVTFNTTEDHSKWAIAVDKPVFCFASMNRMESQETRGGEVVCMENSVVWTLFSRSAIVNTQCPV